MRRTLVLAGLVVLGLVLWVAIEAPRPRTPAERVRGPRVLGTTTGDIAALTIGVREHRLAARRVDGGWSTDAGPAGSPLAAALDGLADTLRHLRALDAFRGDGLAPYGLEPPQGTLDVVTAGGAVRLRLGSMTASSGSLYVAREGHPRVFVVGVYLVSALERALAASDAGRRAPGA